MYLDFTFESEMSGRLREMLRPLCIYTTFCSCHVNL